MLLHPNGQGVYCYTGGKPFDAALPVAVFIHGAQSDHSVWILQTRYFAHHGFAVLAPDLPGHGRSQGRTPESIEQMADWLLALLDVAGARQVLLVGHSMGSLVAMESAARAPERISGLALLGVAYPMKVSAALLDAARENEPAAIDMVNVWSHSSIGQKPSCPGPGFYVQGGSRRLMQRLSQLNPHHLFYTDFAACHAYTNGEQAAAALRCPVLLLLGQQDIMTPVKAAVRLQHRIANLRVRQLQRSGHNLMAEQPDAVLDNLFNFACEILRSSGTQY